jgi:hypothetical protein
MGENLLRRTPARSLFRSGVGSALSVDAWGASRPAITHRGFIVPRYRGKCQAAALDRSHSNLRNGRRVRADYLALSRAYREAYQEVVYPEYQAPNAENRETGWLYGVSAPRLTEIS